MSRLASTSPGAGTEPASGLEAVFLGNRAPLLGFLRSHGAGDAAEDLLQELWLKIGKGGPPGPVAQPLAYLYRAANNLMLDRYRSARQAAKRDHAWSGVVDTVAQPAAERTLIAREQLQQARVALAGVGERAAAVFRRHRLDGIPQRDLASEFGISLTTVESDLRRAYRAMIELRQRLDE